MSFVKVLAGANDALFPWVNSACILLSGEKASQSKHFRVYLGMYNRRDFLKSASAAAAVLAAPHVARAQATSALKFVPAADLAVLDSVWATAYVTRNHSFMVFDTLYGIDENYNPQPQMAAGHTVENDGKLWTITLREGLKFHDNQPVLARDVVASIRRWMQRDAFGMSLQLATEELSAPSDRVIQFRLRKPFPTLPLALGRGSNTMLPILPERLANTPATQQVTEMIGSGPYRYVANERVNGSLSVYRRFEGYVPRPDGKPSFTAGPKIAHIERVEWHTIPDAATAAAALQTGEVDWWEQPTTDLLPVLKSNPQLTITSLDPNGSIGQMRLNHLNPPFNNPAVRRVVLSAINQADYMMVIAGEDQSTWRDKVGVFCPNTPLANQVGIDVMAGSHDYDRIKRDLKQAGYNGEKLVMMAATDYANINAMCEVAGDMFRKMGFNLDYQALDWGSVTARRNSQAPVDQGGWSAHCVFSAGYDLTNPGGNLSLNAVGKTGFVGWPTSPKLVELRNAWFDAPDLPAQQAICRDIQAQFWQDVPYLPLGQFFQPTAFRKNVTGVPRGAFTLFWGVQKA
jgi:peptide/nickel transport system substrate-binding protein